VSSPTLQTLINEILAESRFRKNPYFAALSDGSFELSDFVETQIQFLHAVSFFSRPMAALAVKIPSARHRAEVLRNVAEEHGEGDPTRSHVSTFLVFLSRLAGVTQADVERRALWPEVRLFNTALAGACGLDEYLVGAATLGMIERMFCEISGLIASGVVRRGWIPSARMVHYDLHRELDVRHAQDFFDILGAAWDQKPEDRYAIEQGLRLGVSVFDGLYLNLYRQRSRRLLRGTRGPHCRADELRIERT
jgi:pyrroloquinoline quinone (PQQ) biosynthesis protein C